MNHSATSLRQPLKIGQVGLGLLGRQVAALFRDRKPAGLTLHGVAVRNVEGGRAELEKLGMTTPIIPLQDLVQEVDVVVEMTRAESLREVVEASFNADKTVVIVSGAGLLHCQDLLEQSAKTGRGRLILASGALPGLDSIRGAAEAGITSLRVRSTMGPALMSLDEHVKSMGIDVMTLTEPVSIFRGPPHEAARQFPRHFNVGMALQIAAPGVDIDIEIVVDPSVKDPIHHIEIETPCGGYSLESRSVLTLPTRGGRLVAPSVMACLRRMVDPLCAGS